MDPYSNSISYGSRRAQHYTDSESAYNSQNHSYYDHHRTTPSHLSYALYERHSYREDHRYRAPESNHSQIVHHTGHNMPNQLTIYNHENHHPIANNVRPYHYQQYQVSPYSSHYQDNVYMNRRRHSHNLNHSVSPQPHPTQDNSYYPDHYQAYTQPQQAPSGYLPILPSNSSVHYFNEGSTRDYNMEFTPSPSPMFYNTQTTDIAFLSLDKSRLELFNVYQEFDNEVPLPQSFFIKYKDSSICQVYSSLLKPSLKILVFALFDEIALADEFRRYRFNEFKKSKYFVKNTDNVFADFKKPSILKELVNNPNKYLNPVFSKYGEFSCTNENDLLVLQSKSNDFVRSLIEDGKIKIKKNSYYYIGDICLQLSETHEIIVPDDEIEIDHIDGDSIQIEISQDKYKHINTDEEGNLKSSQISKKLIDKTEFKKNKDKNESIDDTDSSNKGKKLPSEIINIEDQDDYNETNNNSDTNDTNDNNDNNDEFNKDEIKEMLTRPSKRSRFTTRSLIVQSASAKEAAGVRSKYFKDEDRNKAEKEAIKSIHITIPKSKERKRDFSKEIIEQIKDDEDDYEEKEILSKRTNTSSIITPENSVFEKYKKDEQDLNDYAKLRSSLTEELESTVNKIINSTPSKEVSTSVIYSDSENDPIEDEDDDLIEEKQRLIKKPKLNHDIVDDLLDEEDDERTIFGKYLSLKPSNTRFKYSEQLKESDLDSNYILLTPITKPMFRTLSRFSNDIRRRIKKFGGEVSEFSSNKKNGTLLIKLRNRKSVLKSIEALHCMSYRNMGKIFVSLCDKNTGETISKESDDNFIR